MGIQAPRKEKAEIGVKFQEALNEKYAGRDYKPKIAELPPDHRGMATLLIEKAYDFDNIISIDSPYEVDLGFGIPFMFVPDLLLKDGIVENKYTSGYYNEKMLHKEWQPTMYYLGVRRLFGFDPQIKYQLFNTRKKSVELIESPRTIDDIDRFMGWIEDTLTKIDRCYTTGVWQSVTHGFCDYQFTCPNAKT